MKNNNLELLVKRNSVQYYNLYDQNKKHNFPLRKVMLLMLALVTLSYLSFSQNTDNKDSRRFAGAVMVTNKGISTIPSFTLGKPAVQFDLLMGKGKLTFEPQLRFSLEGKPWTFIFWWRYKLLEAPKFNINMGAHPAISFKTIPIINNGVSTDVIVARRYLAGELAPNYALTKGISIGMYYLYSYGLEKNVARHTHFISFRSNFSNIKLSDQYFMKFAPQIYYLKADKEDGYYLNTTLTLAKRNFPLSISSILNKTIKSHVSGSKDFIWNISLTYAFSSKYTKL